MDTATRDDLAVARTQRIIDEINLVHEMQLSLHSRFPSGLQGGAWLLTDSTGRMVVLKWNQHRSARDIARLAEIVERLRGTGYPTPPWLAAGVAGEGFAYHLQDFRHGTQARPFTPTTAALLIDVLERQAGLDPAPEWDRSAAVAAAARDESRGSYRHVVRTLGPAGDALLAAYDELLAPYTGIHLPGGDMVHGDFNTCNLLLDAGAVSAVIDVEELGSGTRVIDYACLLREAYVGEYDTDATQMLLRSGRAIAGPGVLAICAATAAFFIVGFKLRHEPEAMSSILASLHRLAEDLRA